MGFVKCLRKFELVKEPLPWDPFHVLLMWKLYTLQDMQHLSMDNGKQSGSFRQKILNVLSINIPGAIYIGYNTRISKYANSALSLFLHRKNTQS